eukprot:CAMPEP_0181225334 /NCGR_PEP_ID=MMETSP1096-20121128/31627_1 /TAXON_ID=156174 ORGANISM="Chrysochromulina ericina, Strain CCMP281" /NCGR_SAMPLE_ID=MMETSP1096 /ASSEMBLY_ACC=CAM_ASM_000453 /LENGTH=247 /DNA_ID=CAMNT_0023318521 /DNA_START=16 /DNA_END=760 /DNA_ORIENTATION=-
MTSKAPYAERLGIGVGLGFVAGWVDVVTLLRFEAFAGMMTGNINILAADDQVGQNAGFYLTIVVANMLGVLLVHWARKRVVRNQIPVVATCAFVCIIACDLLLLSKVDADSSKWLMCFIAVAFGAQNAVSMLGEVGVPTTIVTGHIQKIPGLLFEVLSSGMTPMIQGALVMSGSIVLATAMGAFTVASISKARDGKLSWLLIIPGALQWTLLLLQHGFGLKRERSQTLKQPEQINSGLVLTQASPAV